MVVVAVVAAVVVCVERCGVAVVFFMCVAFVFRLFDLWKSKGLGLSPGSKTDSSSSERVRSYLSASRRKKRMKGRRSGRKSNIHKGIEGRWSWGKSKIP